MTHEPGRERHMHHKCEKCGTAGALAYYPPEDENWCESCIDNAHEAAYQRYQEYLMETSGGPTLVEQQAAARKLK